MSDPLAAAAEAAGETGAWLVGGAVRDRRLDRPTFDYDVVLDGDPQPLARAVGRAAGGHVFALSEAFGAWRVVARDHRWQLDVLRLLGTTLADDLGRRDLTINAIAEPLAGGPPLDPFGGIGDLAARRLRMVSPRSFVEDPLRVLRVARFAAQLGFAADAETVASARGSASALDTIAPERTFAELRELLAAPGAVAGLALMDDLGATASVLPELAALDGVGQSRFHHLDVAAHTRAVLTETIALTDEPARLGLDPVATATLATALAQPLTGELTRGEALRLGALLHDIAKSRTRAVNEGGRVTFMGHDRVGAEMTLGILGRLRASQALAAHVAALTRHHLRLGFLVHRMPLARHEVYDYLTACAPVAVDVSVLSVADRLATRGDDAERAIARHLELAREMIPEALANEADPPAPPVRGDVLAVALGIEPGPRLGELLESLRSAAFTGEATNPEQAIALARRLLADAGER